MPLLRGEAAPWFTAPTVSSPEFVFDTAAGRYVLMAFLPADPVAGVGVLKALAAHQALFDDEKIAAFAILPNPEAVRGLRDVRGLRWFPDASGAIQRLFGGEAHWLLLDPALRVLASAPIESPESLLAELPRLPPPSGHAGVALHAPVLVAPDVFEPELCEALIGHLEAEGAQFTGVMRDSGDRTVAVMDDLKRRRDILVQDPALQAAVRERLRSRLFPRIAHGLGFEVTQIERLLVSCYDAADGGVFRPHRDDTTQGTAHRRFACSINLNAAFEGGDLRFPEFGAATYRPPLGGAVVFSCALMHEVLPLTSGRRYAFLPFFFDDAAADVLAAYRARTAVGAGA